MKTAPLSLIFFALILHAVATDVSRASPQRAPNPEPAKVSSVATSADKRALIVRYEIDGKAYEERITFAQEIADFRHCPWMGDTGIAIVARTGGSLVAAASFSEDGKRVRFWTTGTGAGGAVKLWDARTGVEVKPEYFYCTLYLSGTPEDHKPMRIPAPEIVNPVLGIGNTIGDSVVITAVQHRRSPADHISGWVHIDNCPLPDGKLAIGHLTPFTVPAERPPNK
ncbi:MAG: hypothetical protein ABI680_07435 [Chthoniobacteraceae bacterium]